MGILNNNNSRFGALLSHYIRLVLLFMAEKPLFMLYNGSIGARYSLRDWLNVVWHGLTIDLSVAAYLTFIPLLLLIVNIWCSKCPVKKIWSAYNGLVALVLALIFVGDAALYPYWGFKLDGTIFFYLRTPGEAFASTPAGMTVLGGVVVIVLAFFIGWYLSRAFKPVDMPFNTVLIRIPVSLFYIALALPLTVVSRGGLKQSTMNIGHAYFSSDQFLNHSAVNPAFSLLSSMSKTSDYSKWYDYLDEDERMAMFDGLYEATDSCTEKLLNTDSPNVLVLVLEGFGGDFINAISGRSDVAPHLDSLINQGVFFSNCYAGSFRTDRGLVCIMNGHPGLPVTSIMKLPVKSAALPSLPARFAERGYATHFMYGGDINFTNMNSWLYGAGFQNVVSDVDFSISERHSNAWGVNDDITFSRLFNEIKEDNDSLWFRSMLSLSSHEPFEVPYTRLDDKICNAFAYTDSCVGALVDSLRSTPIWDNLLLVITPDHGFRYPQQGFAFDPHVHHIPVLWLGGAVKEPRVIDRLTAQSDMAATILAQLGMDHSDFRFSRNVLSGSYAYPFSFYTFSNGFCFIDSTGVTLYDDDSSSCLINDSYGSESRLKRGKSIVQTLYDDLENR